MKQVLCILREQHGGVQSEIMDYEIGDIPNVVRMELVGYYVILAALECAIWMPHLLDDQGCERLPYVPVKEKRQLRRNYSNQSTGDRWVMRGHFATPRPFITLWAQYLTPLGVEITLTV